MISPTFSMQSTQNIQKMEANQCRSDFSASKNFTRAERGIGGGKPQSNMLTALQPIPPKQRQQKTNIRNSGNCEYEKESANHSGLTAMCDAN